MKNTLILLPLFLLSFFCLELTAQQELIYCDWGYFKHHSGGEWVESNNDGDHHFREINRANNRIELRKVSGGYTFLIDLNDNQVYLNNNYHSKVEYHNVVTSGGQEKINSNWGYFLHIQGDEWVESNGDGIHHFREQDRANNRIVLKKVSGGYTYVIDLNNDEIFLNNNYHSRVESHNINTGGSGSTGSAESLENFVKKITDNVIGSGAGGNNQFEIRNITLRMLLSELGKSSSEIRKIMDLTPAPILDKLKLTSCTANLDPVGKKAGLKIFSEYDNFKSKTAATISRGDKGMTIIFGGQASFLTGIIKLIGIKAESKDLAAIDKYFNHQVGFAISNNPSDAKLGLPIFKNQKLASGITVLGEAGLNFDNIFQRIPKMDPKSRTILKQVFGTTKWTLKGELPSKPTTAYIEGGLDLGIGIPDPFHPKYNIMTLGKMSLGMRLDPVNTKLHCGNTLTLHLRGQNPKDITNLAFTGKFTMKPTDASVGVEMLFTGANGKDSTAGWVHPFGIPGIEVRKLAIGGSLEANIPWVNGAISGDMSLGMDYKRDGKLIRKAKKIGGKMGLGIDVNSPQSSFLDMSVSSFTLEGLMDAFPFFDIPENSEFRKGLQTGLTKTKIYVAPSNIEFGGEVYEQGISLGTHANIFGWKAHYNFELNPDPFRFKFLIDGEMDPIKVEFPVSGKNVTVFEMKGFTTKGPKLLVKAKIGEFPEANINGNIRVLKIGNNPAFFTGKGKIVFNKNEMTMHGKADLFGLYDSAITLKADKYTDLRNAKFIATATVTSDQKLKKKLSEEILKNAQKGVKDAERLKKAITDPSKPLQNSAINLYVELKKGENSIADAAVYVLNEGFSIDKLHIYTEVNNRSSKADVDIDVSIAGKKVNKKFSMNVSNLEVEKTIEQIALKVLEEFKTQGTALIKQIEQTNTEVWNELSNIFEVPFSHANYTVEIDYKAGGMNDGGYGPHKYNPVIIVLKDADKKVIGQLKSTEFPKRWTFWENFTVPGKVKRTRHVKYIEVKNSFLDALFLDDLILKLNGKEVFRLDTKSDLGWAVGAGVPVTDWKKYLYDKSSSFSQGSFEVNTDRVQDKAQEYLLSFHYAQKGNTKVTATFYDENDRVIASNVEMGYAKPIVGWQEMKPIKTKKTIAKVKLFNSNGTPYSIDLIRIHQEGIHIFQKGVRGKNGTPWKDDFDFKVQ